MHKTPPLLLRPSEPIASESVVDRQINVHQRDHPILVSLRIHAINEAHFFKDILHKIEISNFQAKKIVCITRLDPKVGPQGWFPKNIERQVDKKRPSDFCKSLINKF